MVTEHSVRYLQADGSVLEFTSSSRGLAMRRVYPSRRVVWAFYAVAYGVIFAVFRWVGEL